MKTHLERISQEKFPTTVWDLIPPYAPWWGGFCERVVGMMKKKLRTTSPDLKVRNSLHAHFILQHISGCLNTRPLWVPSSDVTDMCAMTPSSFTRPITTGPDLLPIDADNETCKLALQRLYAEQSKAVDQLWVEFHLGYLNALREHQKAVDKIDTSTLKVDDFVLYHSPRLVRNFWPMGRVTKVYPDEFGVVRAVKLAKYVPNKINTPLKNQRYPKRTWESFSPEIKKELTGYFQHQANVYPVHKLVRMEFWKDTNPSVSDTTTQSSVPVLLTSLAGNLYEPELVSYAEQEKTCWKSLFPITSPTDKIQVDLMSKLNGEPDSKYVVESTPHHLSTIAQVARANKSIKSLMTIVKS